MTKPKIKPELILPAGDLNRAKIALRYGADAIYLGLDKYSLRKAEVRFDKKGIKEAIDYAHELGKRVFVTFNIFAHNFNLTELEKDMADIAKFGPDAFIIADPGVLMIAQKAAPNVPIHISTQANTVNKESVRFWKNLGVKRVVLARELTLKEIAEIHRAVPDIELEAFVHGAMCVSYSGRCLLSNYLTGRSANLGACAQPCRWNYKVYSDQRAESRDQRAESRGLKRKYFIEEENRPGELMPIEEDEKGTYIMSSKDLNLIGHIDGLINAGVTGFKIEGRNKTGYYVATTARAYRKAIDTATSKTLQTANKKKIYEKLIDEVNNLTRRGYTTGFLFGNAKKGELFPTRSPIEGKRYLGFIEKEENGNYLVSVKNKIEKGKTYEVITPTETIKIKITELLDRNRKPVEVANPGRAEGEQVWISTDKKLPVETFIRE